MALPQGQPAPPMERWRLWLGRILLIPLVAMSGAMVFGLYHVLERGEIQTVARGFRVSSSAYTFRDNPVSFILVFALFAALAGLIIFVTVLVAKRVLPGTVPK